MREGIVLDQDGSPVEGAMVYVAWGTADFQEIALETDSKGRFFLDLPDGRFRVEAIRGGKEGQTEVVHDESETGELIRIVLETVG